jgi:uncharacterized membrane protein
MTRSEKWLLTGFGLSLALNGLLIALLFFQPGHRHDRHHGPDVRIGRLEQHLKPESREVLRGAVDSNRDALKQEFDSLRDARDDVAAALEKEPFDRAALEAAFAEVEKHQDVIRATVQRSFIEAASRLPVEERIKLAKGGERYMRRMFGPRRDDGPDGGPGGDGPPPQPGP